MKELWDKVDGGRKDVIAIKLKKINVRKNSVRMCTFALGEKDDAMYLRNGSIWLERRSKQCWNRITLSLEEGLQSNYVEYASILNKYYPELFVPQASKLHFVPENGDPPPLQRLVQIGKTQDTDINTAM